MKRGEPEGSEQFKEWVARFETERNRQSWELVAGSTVYRWARRLHVPDRKAISIAWWWLGR